MWDGTQSSEELIISAIGLDNRLRERQKEMTGIPSFPVIQPFRLDIHFPNISIRGRPFQSSHSSSSSVSSSLVKPVHLGNIWLIPAECWPLISFCRFIHCGRSGHFLASSLLWPKGLAHQQIEGRWWAVPRPPPLLDYYWIITGIPWTSYPIHVLVHSLADDYYFFILNSVLWQIFTQML